MYLSTVITVILTKDPTPHHCTQHGTLSYRRDIRQCLAEFFKKEDEFSPPLLARLRVLQLQEQVAQEPGSINQPLEKMSVSE